MLHTVKSGCQATVPVFEMSSQMGTYFQGVCIFISQLIRSSTTVHYQKITCVYQYPHGIYFRSRVSFSANYCAMFIAFLQPEIQSTIDQLFPTSPTNVKCLDPCEAFANSLMSRTLPKFWLVSCVDSLQSGIDTSEKQLLCSNKPNQQVHFGLHGDGWVPIFSPFYGMYVIDKPQQTGSYGP